MNKTEERATAKKYLEEAEKLTKEGVTKEAIEKYQQVIKLMPKLLLAHFQLGKLYRKEKQLKKAIKHLESVLKIKQEHPQAQKRLNKLKEQQEKRRNKQNKDKENPELYDYLLGDEQRKNGKLAEACESYQKAIDNQPKEKLDIIYGKLAQTWLDMAEAAKAIAAYKKASEIKPNNYKYYQQIAEVYAKQGKLDEAIEEQKKAIEKSGNNPICKYYLMNYEEQKKNKEELKDIKYTIISLGFHCLPRTLLTRWGVKKTKIQGEKSCPFDLAVHPLASVCKLIENDFEDYLNVDFFRKKIYHKKKGEEIIVQNTKYDSRFSHTVGEAYFENNYEKIVQTYQKRIENFYNYISENNILFVWFGRTENSAAKELDKIIRKKFPDLYFKIAFINQKENQRFYNHKNIILHKACFPSKNYS